MARKEEPYKVGEFEIVGKQEKGRAHTIRKVLESYLNRAGMDNYVQVRVENNRVIVYGNPITETLERFSRIQTDKRKIQVKFIPTINGQEETSGELDALQGRYNNLEEQYHNTVTKNTKLEGRIRDLRSEVRSLHSRVKESEEYCLELEEEREGLKVLRRSARPKELEDILRQNERDFVLSQEDLMINVFNQISKELETRETYDNVEGLKKARDTIKRKDGYIKKYGENSLRNLPESARELAEKEWAKAEEIIEQYERYRENALPLPIRIADTGEGLVITLPIDPGSTNEVPKSLYDALIRFGEEISDKISNLKIQVAKDEPFVTMKFGGEIDIPYMKEKLIKNFENVAERSNVKIKILETPYMAGYSLDRGVWHYIKETPSADVDKMTEEATLAEFIKKRITELGYPSQKQFAEKNNIPKGTLYPITTGRANPGKANKEKLAKALEVPLSEIEKYLK